MRYFSLRDEAFHVLGGDRGGDPTVWLEVNDDGDAERELQIYPGGKVLRYDRENPSDAYGALSVMVIDDNETWWARHEVTSEEFERQWRDRSQASDGRRAGGLRSDGEFV